MNNQQLLFIHIPKTAGTSLRGLIYNQYDDNRVASVYEGMQHFFSEAEFSELPTRKINNLDVVIGHFGYGFHRHLVSCSRPIRYATFMRAPVKRCLSLYNHLANLSFKGNPPKFKELIKAPIGVQFDNYQTRMISGCYPKFGQCNREMLELAIKRIENEFDFVGITELFNESLVVATDKLGWKVIPYTIHNTSVQMGANMTGHLSSEGQNNDLELIQKLNLLDIELYDYCKNKLLANLEETSEWHQKLLALSKQLDAQVHASNVVHSIGCLGELRETKIVGWARLKQSDITVRVRIEINECRKYIVPAIIKRADLKRVDLVGCCGFELLLPNDVRLKTGDQVRAWCMESGQELSNSPCQFSKAS